MFTDEDYERYFDQIGRVERKMIYGVYDLAEEIKDPAMVGVFQKIGDDEVRHYGYVLKMLKGIGAPRRSENRCESREYCLGTIQLRRSQDPAGHEIKTYCVNLSKKGVCLEGSADLYPGEVCELTIRLFDKEEITSHQGKVVWNKEVEPGFYIGGIVFETIA
jgi:hypothetical protein